jgi:hypothetical protein
MIFLYCNMRNIVPTPGTNGMFVMQRIVSLILTHRIGHDGFAMHAMLIGHPMSTVTNAAMEKCASMCFIIISMFGKFHL